MTLYHYDLLKLKQILKIIKSRDVDLSRPFFNFNKMLNQMNF